MTQEHLYLQFFCGFEQYKDKPSFSASLMAYFRKRLAPKILGKINELIIQRTSEQEEAHNGGDNNDSGDNNGTLVGAA